MKYLAALSIVTCFLCGCSREAAEKSVSQPLNYESLSQVPADAVVLDVGGDKITKKGFCDHLDMMFELYKNRHPSLPKEKLNSARVRMRMGAVNEIVSRASLKRFFCETNVAASATLRDELQQNYIRVFGRKNQSFEDLKDAMYAVGKGEVFERTFEDDLMIQAALRINYSNELVVTAEDILYARERQAKYNARAAATNELILANIATVTNKLAKGEDFSKLADQYSMGDDKSGGEIGICDLDDFNSAPDEYRRAVSELKPGKVSSVLETSMTYEILKAEPVPEENKEDGLVWNLRRIQFNKPYFIEEMNDSALSELIYKNNCDKLLARLESAIRTKSKVLFPLGKRILDFKQAKKPGMLKNKKGGQQ